MGNNFGNIILRKETSRLKVGSYGNFYEKALFFRTSMDLEKSKTSVKSLLIEFSSP